MLKIIFRFVSYFRIHYINIQTKYNIYYLLFVFDILFQFIVHLSILYLFHHLNLNQISLLWSQTSFILHFTSFSAAWGRPNDVKVERNCLLYCFSIFIGKIVFLWEIKKKKKTEDEMKNDHISMHTQQAFNSMSVGVTVYSLISSFSF